LTETIQILSRFYSDGFNQAKCAASAGLEIGGPWAKLISRALFPLFSRDFLYQQARHSKDAEKILF
jgi:hypothetical protein